jgi:phage FluMu protein Com
MRAKCPKCGAVFEVTWHPTLVHIKSIKLLFRGMPDSERRIHTLVID